MVDRLMPSTWRVVRRFLAALVLVGLAAVIADDRPWTAFAIAVLAATRMRLPLMLILHMERPLLSLSDAGLTLHPAYASIGTMPYRDIRKATLTEMRINYVSMRMLHVKGHSAAHLPGWLRFPPVTWHKNLPIDLSVTSASRQDIRAFCASLSEGMASPPSVPSSWSRPSPSPHRTVAASSAGGFGRRNVSR